MIWKTTWTDLTPKGRPFRYNESNNRRETLGRLKLTKEKIDTHFGLQGIKPHWENPSPILSVSNIKNRSGAQEYPGTEVRSMKKKVEEI